MSFQSHNISLLKKLKAELRSSEQIAIQKAKELSQYKKWDGIKDEFEKGRFSESLYKRAKERFGDKADSLRKELSEANSRTNFIKSKISRIIVQDPSLSCLLFFDDFDEQGKGDLLIKGKSVHVKDNRTQYSDVILINSKNEILFTVRNKNDNFEPGKYCLPGGHIEEDEEPISAAVRELEEETGISLKESQIQPCGQYFDRKSHINYFCAHYDGDPVVLDEREHQQFEWVSIDDVNDKPLLMNLKENFKNIIEIPKSILNPLADNAKKYYFSGDEITREELLERLRVLENLYKGFLEGKVFLQDYENEKNFLDIEKGLGSEEFLFIDSRGNPYWNISINDLNKAYYKDNWLNRKLGRVNMFYGGSDGGGGGNSNELPKKKDFPEIPDKIFNDTIYRLSVNRGFSDKDISLIFDIALYTTGLFNDYSLENETPEKLKKIEFRADKELKKIPMISAASYKKEIPDILYSGQIFSKKFFNEKISGKKFLSFDKLFSTSAREDVSKRFLDYIDLDNNQEIPVLFKIKNYKSAKGISNLSEWHDEEEFLFPRNVVFEINAIDEDESGDYKIVYLKENIKNEKGS